MHTHRHKPTTLAQPRPTGATTLPAAPCNKDHSPLVAADDIRLCAYRKWERAGKPTGDGIQFWLQAEQQLVQGK